MIKTPSAANLHFELLSYLCKDYEGEIHLSLGMTTRAEEEKIVDFFRRPQRIVGYYSSLFPTVAELLRDSVEITALDIPRERVNDLWLSFLDGVYRYYRTELNPVVRAIESPAYRRPYVPSASS